MVGLRFLSVSVLVFAGLTLSPGQEAAKKQTPTPMALDLSGDPLPPGAVQRFGSSRLRHGSRVLSLAFSPNGRILAAGGGDDPVRLWDTDTGNEIRQCKDFWVTNMVFSTYGSMLATAGPFKTIRLWHVDKGKEVNQLKGHTGRITALAFYKEGLLASADSDGVIRLWELSTALEITQLKGHVGEIAALAFSSNGKLLLSGGHDRTLRVWDAENMKPLYTIDTDSPVTAVAMTPDRQTIYSGGDDGSIRVWNAATRKEGDSIHSHTGAITSLIVHVLQDDDFKITSVKLISASRDKTIRVRDLSNTKRKPLVITRHESDCDALAVSRDGKTITCAGLNNTLRRFDLSSGEEQFPPVAKGEPGGAGHQAPVTSLAQSSDGRVLASVSSKGTLRLWDSTSGRNIRHWPVAGNGEVILTFSPDGKTLAVARESEPVRLYDLQGSEKTQLAGPPNDSVLSLAYAPDGKSLAVGYSTGSVRLWDWAQAKPALHLKVEGPAQALAFSANGAALAVSGSAKVSVFDWPSAQLTREFGGREGPTATLPSATCMAFLPDSKTLAVAGYDGLIRLWNTETGKEVRSLEGHTSAVYGISVSRDGRHLVSASFDRTVRLWETFGGGAVSNWQGHTGPATAVAFAPTGRVAFSGSADTTVLAWDVTGLSAGQALPTLQEPEFQNLWRALSSLNAAEGNRALWRLVASAETSVPMLARSVFVLNREQLQQQLKDLNDTNYRVREKATKELAAYGRWIEGVLREAIKKPPSEEVRRRLDGLLQKLAGSGALTIEQERLRARRVMLALEQMARPEASAILERLAKGAPEDELCAEAQASLTRLSKQRQ